MNLTQVGRFHPFTGYEGPQGEQKYSSTLFLTSALDGGEGSPYPRERHGTHCTGGWVGFRVGLDRCEKFLPHRDSIPGPSRPQAVAIPTTLPGPTSLKVNNFKIGYYDIKWKYRLSVHGNDTCTIQILKISFQPLIARQKHQIEAIIKFLCICIVSR